MVQRRVDTCICTVMSAKTIHESTHCHSQCICRLCRCAPTRVTFASALITLHYQHAFTWAGLVPQRWKARLASIALVGPPKRFQSLGSKVVQHGSWVSKAIVATLARVHCSEARRGQRQCTSCPLKVPIAIGSRVVQLGSCIWKARETKLG